MSGKLTASGVIFLPEHKEERKEEHKEEHKAHKEEPAPKKSEEGFSIKKSTLMLVSFTIIALIIGFAAGFLISGTGQKPSASTQPNEAIGRKAIEFLNKNVVQPGTNATYVSMSEENGLYKIITEYQGSQIPIYASTDGNVLFLSQPVLTNETLPQQQPAQTTTASSITPQAKSSAELFVMSFCPYGVQAEQIMKPVVDTLSGKADIKVRFIVNIQGNTTDSVQSLHGTKEAQEDLRQVCIDKYYPSQYWSYVNAFDQNCYPQSGDQAAIDACWKSTAGNLSMDVSKIQSCSQSSEALDLLKVDEQISNAYGVTGSPTLIINGATYNGARSSDGFQQAICSGFTTPPAECGSVVNATAVASPTAGCTT